MAGGVNTAGTATPGQDETFWNKFGTLGRKKQLEENEERSMIEPKSFENPKLKELIRVLMDWINDELHTERIIVQDIEEDLYDGQILQKLMEKLTGEHLAVPEVTLSEDGQRSKLRVVLAFANK